MGLHRSGGFLNRKENPSVLEDLPGSDTGDNGLGGPKVLSETTLVGRIEGFRCLEADRYPFVEAVFGFEVVRWARGLKSLAYNRVTDGW